MKFSEHWLRTLCNPPIDSNALCDKLTMGGLEVEEARPAAPPFSGVVVGRIDSIAPHPDAERLRVCSVDVGAAAPLQIVCGAPNAAAGMLAPCALEGAVLPGNFAIKRAKMRGVESHGMLCSAKELGIDDDASGLLALDASLKPGTPLRDALALDDSLITLKITPNRADCLSLAGIARDVSALTGTPLSLPIVAATPVAFDGVRAVRIEAPAGTVVNPVLPAACGARGVIGYRVYDAIMGALAPLVPDRVLAAGEGGPTLIAWGGYDEARRPFGTTEVLVGTWGARLTRDGLEGVSNPLANLGNQPIELIEADLPLKVERYGVVPDSGGAGRQRGGLAFVREYRVLARRATLTIRTDRRDHPPYGLEGGEAGAPSSNVVVSDGVARELPTMPMEALTLEEGDTFTHVSAGGGGFGPPFERDPAAVLADVLDGKVSVAAARDRYGVVIARGSVDVKATASVREAR